MKNDFNNYSLFQAIVLITETNENKKTRDNFLVNTNGSVMDYVGYTSQWGEHLLFENPQQR